MLERPKSELPVATRVTECPSNLSRYSKRKSAFHSTNKAGTGKENNATKKKSIPSEVCSVRLKLKEC